MTELLSALALLGAAFVAGTYAGLHLAWTQPARMRRWADSVAARAESRNGGPE